MVVDDFNVKAISLAPDEANAPLVVDSNTVLAFPVAR
jgi:hypothetical protein